MRFPVLRFSPGSLSWGALFLSTWLVASDGQCFAQSSGPLPSFGAEEPSSDAMTLGRPSTSESLAMRGFTLRQENNLQGAIDSFEAALRKGGLDGDQQRSVQSAIIEARLQQAVDRIEKAFDRNDLKTALTEARKAVDWNPTAEYPALLLADALARSGEQDQAIAVLSATIARQASGQSLSQRGYLRREVGDPRGAIDDFEAALRKGGLDAGQVSAVRSAIAEAHLQLTVDGVEAALNRDDLNTALAEARKAAALAPQAEYPALLLSDVLIRSDKRSDALAWLSAFIARQPTSRLLAKRGYLYRDDDDIANAIGDFEAALRKNGLDTAERRQIEAAKDSLEKLILTRQIAKLLDSGNKLLDRDDGDNVLNAAQLDRVISDAQDALRLDPSSHSATHLLSVALIRAGRRDEALGALSQAIARGGDVGALLAERGFLLRDMGDFVGARRDFQSAMKGSSR